MVKNRKSEDSGNVKVLSDAVARLQLEKNDMLNILDEYTNNVWAICLSAVDKETGTGKQGAAGLRRG